MSSPENQYLRLLHSAEQAVHRAYAPYSGVHVGAAVQDSIGKQFLGANIENASYGLTCCAERVALFSALMDGVHPYSGGRGGDLANRQVKAIAVASNWFTPTTPCGACRQVLLELCAPETQVLMRGADGGVIETTVAALLPGGFQMRPSGTP